MRLWQLFRDRVESLTQQSRWKNSRIRRVIWGVLFFALLTLALANQTVPTRLNVSVGDLAPMDVPAPRPVLNRVQTDERRLAAEATVTTIYTRDPGVLEVAGEFVKGAFKEIRRVQALTGVEDAAKVQDLADSIRLGVIPPDVYATLLSLDEAALSAAETEALTLLQSALGEEVYERDVARIKELIDQGTEPFDLGLEDPSVRLFVRELVKKRIQVNMVEDLEQTNWVRQRAAQEVPEVWWQKGQLVIKANEPITKDQYEMLVDLGMVGGGTSYGSWAGSALLALVMVGVMALYLLRYRPDLLERDSKLLLLGLIGFLTLLLSLLMSIFDEQLGSGAAYLMPVAFNSMLVTILLDSKVAMLQSVLISLLVGLFSSADQMSHAVVAVMGSMVGVYAVSRVESRTDLYRAGLFVGLANVLSVLSLYLLQSASLLDWRVWRDVAIGGVNGLLVAILVTGALPFFENLFGVVTPLKLLELSNPNHPLLKKLMVEAPGSYHHTILVANLCEAAAEAIGADQVLARVGAYYHDIGKIKRPAFFVENQFGGENPHDKLPPSLSAMIITSHVKEGVELAKEAGLPQEIVDFIPEHHGTMLVSYFYYMASKNGQSEYVLEEDFRYDGPKPRRKETAICMLADGCEASVRAMRQRAHLSYDQIEQQVRRIITDRLQQGQLDNCDLTLKELDKIAKVFVKVLSGVHHARIEYPAEMKAAGAQGQLPEPAKAEGEAQPSGDGQSAAVEGAEAQSEGGEARAAEQTEPAGPAAEGTTGERGGEEA